MSLNLFLPKTFKPAKWKRLHDPAMDFECVMRPTRPEQKPITLHSEPITYLCGSRADADAFVDAMMRYYAQTHKAASSPCKSS